MEAFGSAFDLPISLSGLVGSLGDSHASVCSIFRKPKDLKLIVLFRFCRYKISQKRKEGENRRDSYLIK